MTAHAHTTCRIQWVDEAGRPTPDNNKAVGYVRLPRRTITVHGRTVTFDATEEYPVCAEHAAALSGPDMTAWIFRALDEGDV